jgi:hypothetical protein
LVYFVPEAGARYGELGITGGMRGYFASRSAPLGLVSPELVISTFYNFAPARVRRAIPSVWETCTPEQVLAARVDVVDGALRRLIPDAVESDEMAEAAALARTATEAADIVGRPLYAAHAALPWPEQPHLALWHATTLLREHRGDGHIAALVLAGLSGLEAAVSYVAAGNPATEEIQRSTRGYSEEEWQEGKNSLHARGVLDADGAITDAGRALRGQIEAQTDVAAAAPYEHLGTDKTERLIELVTPWSASITKQIFG